MDYNGSKRIRMDPNASKCIQMHPNASKLIKIYQNVATEQLTHSSLKSTVQQPHSNHIITAQQLHNNHITTTKQPHSNHISTTQKTNSNHIATTQLGTLYNKVFLNKYCNSYPILKSRVYGLWICIGKSICQCVTHGINKDSWYRHGLMVLTTAMVLTYTHGIVSVLLNHKNIWKVEALEGERGTDAPLA